MLTGILILAVVMLLGALSHRRSRLENRIYQHVPVVDWLNVLVFPILLYIGWVMVVKNIIERPMTNIIPFDDFDILSITILFMVYGFTGNAIHFTGKILWRYLHGKRNSIVYKINEMFHGRLSHYLVFLNCIFIAFLLSMLEINHPVFYPLSQTIQFWIVLSGIIFGFSSSKAVFYSNEWFGGYNKPLFFITTLLMMLLILLMKFIGLKYIFYPVNLFIVSMFVCISVTFLVRQMFIFARLNNRRKLRFLAKILSV